MQIKIYTMGGTIDKIYFDKKNNYHVGSSISGDILREASVAFSYDVESIIAKDSLDMTDEDRSLLISKISKDKCDRILITHGTDTMVATAKILKEEIKNKVIVLTGSMIPARFKSSDAVFNIAFALAAVQILGNGIYIAMNGTIFLPNNVRKNVELSRFEKINEKI